MSRARVALLCLLGAVLVAAAVVGLRLQQPEPRAAGPDLSATAELQWARTTDEANAVWIWVANHGSEPVRVRALELVTESFAPTGPVGKDDVAVPAGVRRALTVGYGPGRCGGQAAPELAPVTARLVLAGSPGVTAGTEVELALPHPDDQLARLLRTDCTAQLVAGAVAVRFAGWSPAPGESLRGESLRGELIVERRRGDAPVSVYDVAGNVLFRLVADHPEPLRPVGALAPGETRLVVPVAVDVNRCDQHAVVEAKLRYLLQVWIGVGDSEHLPVTVNLDQAGRDQFDQLLRARCNL